MPNIVFNVGLGRAVELYLRVDGNDPTNSAFVVLLIAATGVETDAILKDKDNIDALVGAAVPTNEATNSGYARKPLTDTDLLAFTPDDVNDRADLDIPDITWLTVGNDGTGAISDFVVAYDSDTTAGTDVNMIPVTLHDFSVTPDGSNITAQISASGFFRAS